MFVAGCGGRAAALRYNAGMPNGSFPPLGDWLRPALACALWWALGAALPALAQVRKAAPAETPLSLCVAANRQALLDLTQATQASLRRHVMSPMVVTRLQALQSQLGKVRDISQRSVRNVAECEQAGEAIAAEKDRLLKIAGPDPEAADCMANNQKLHTAVAQAFEAVQRSGRVPPDQLAALEASGGRLNQISAALARDSMLPADCRLIGEQIGQERSRVEGWMGALGIAPAVSPAPAAPSAPVAPVASAATPPAATAATAAAGTAPAAVSTEPAAALQACRDQHARTYNELAQALATVNQGAPLAADKMPQFQSVIERLTRLRGLIADRSGPGWDCAQVSQGLEQVRGELQPLLPAGR